MAIRLVLSILLGALAGFGFHRLVGCRSGACAIWANPFASTIYGAVLGFAIGSGP